MTKIKNNTKKPALYLLVAVILCASVIFSACGSIMSEEFLMRTESPDNTYIVEAYRASGGTVGESLLKVYRTEDDSKNLIYIDDKNEDVKISWNGNDKIIINDVTLDLSKNEKYDSRD